MKTWCVLLASAVLCGPVAAAEIYRWVDDSGRVTYSDNVPQKYRKSAFVIDTREMEVSAEQRKAAEDRAAREREFLAEAQRRRERDEALHAAGTQIVVPAVGSRAITVPPNAGCGVRQQAFRESQECFAPFRMANGAVRVEAFPVCGNPIPDPSPQCGTTTW